MKKVIVILLFVFNSGFINAQSPISKGSLTLGGSISFSSQSYEKYSDNFTTITFIPQIGYFFIDNFYTSLLINYQRLSMGGGLIIHE